MTIIDRVIATEVIVPARRKFVDRSAFGDSLFDKKSKWILEIFTSDGLIGYGENLRGTSLVSIEYGVRYILGKPLHELSWSCPVPPDLAANDSLGHPNPPVPHRFHELDLTTLDGSFGISLAVFDLWAKSLNVPAHRLLGGAVRDSVATSWWFGRSDSEHAKEQMRIGWEAGFTSVKIKATAEDDVFGIVKSIKEVAGEEALIIIDPNRRFYRLAETLKIARQLEQFSNVVLEDPFPFNVREWQLMRHQTEMPIALHTGDWFLGAREHCCDYLNLGYPITRFQGDAHAASLMGMQCWHGSGLELGIMDAYILQASAVARSCTLPGDAIGHRIRENDLIEESLIVVDGAIQLPTGAGLGVTLDRAALAQYAVQRFEWRK